jgi:hypothetical protein
LGSGAACAARDGSYPFALAWMLVALIFASVAHVYQPA